jgi:hypothetical protein
VASMAQSSSNEDLINKQASGSGTKSKPANDNYAQNSKATDFRQSSIPVTTSQTKSHGAKKESAPDPAKVTTNAKSSPSYSNPFSKKLGSKPAFSMSKANSEPVKTAP